MILFEYNDGGRVDADYKGETGDCVTRAIAIASGKPYKEVYDELFARAKEYGRTRRTRAARAIQVKGATPRNGVNKDVYAPYLESLGFEWVPTMHIGQGCKVHLKADELPSGVIIWILYKEVNCNIYFFVTYKRL